MSSWHWGNDGGWHAAQAAQGASTGKGYGSKGPYDRDEQGYGSNEMGQGKGKEKSNETRHECAGCRNLRDRLNELSEFVRREKGLRIQKLEDAVVHMTADIDVLKKLAEA